MSETEGDTHVARRTRSISRSPSCASTGFDQLPIVGASNKPIGLVTLGNLMSLVSSGRLKLADAVRAQIRQ